MEKQCTICKQIKPSSEFRKRYEGLMSFCKTCHTVRDQKYRATYKEKHANGFKLDTDFKFCPACEDIKPLNDFSKNLSCGLGVSSYCKVCQIEQHLKHNYSMSIMEYNYLWEKQQGKCYLTGKSESENSINPKTNKPHRLAVDHCKYTGKIRGLALSGANLGIGLFNHDPQLLRQVADALEYATNNPVKIHKL